MRNDTHSVMITDGTGKPLAYTDGVPDKCQHDDNGEWLHFNNDGVYWKESEIPTEELQRYQFAIENKITGGCCSCSKCGKPFTPDFWSMP